MTTTTSVELRIENREVVCDWGGFGEPVFVWNYETQTVTVENVAPLVLVSKGFADGRSLPNDPWWGEIATFYTNAGRRLMRITAANGSWIWELYDTHWDDGEPSNVYIGRWRD